MRYRLQVFPGFALNGRIQHVLYFVAVLSAAYYFTQLRFDSVSELPTATLEALVQGTASTPFQYRALIPWIAAGVLKLKLPILNSPQQVFKLIDFVSILLLIAVFRNYLKQFFERDEIPTLLSLSIFYILPFSYLLPRHLIFLMPSDLPAVLLFTLGLHLLYRKNWPLYYIVFVLGVFNRETICFLTVIYLVVAFGRENRRTIALHCILQIVLWGAIKLLLFVLYADNPGAGLFELKHISDTWDRFHLVSNVAFLLRPLSLPFFLSALGFLWIPVLLLRRSIPVEFLRRAVLVLIPFFLSMMLISNIHELRIYGELTPVILVPFLLILREWLNGHAHAERGIQ